jgi:hypothetical protein
MKYNNSNLAKGLRSLLTASLITAAGFSTASAALISITTGNPGNAGTDNVLFNDGSLSHSGLLVQGNFSGSGSGYIVDFTSASGSGLLTGGGGQATVEGGVGNVPFTNLSFFLENGATFTKAILNPDVQNSSGDGTINFTVTYIYGLGSPYTETFSVTGNGANFFGIEATGGAAITKVTFATTDTAFIDSSQFRLGGFAPAQSGGRVPDGGTTIALLGVSLLGLGSARRIFAVKA